MKIVVGAVAAALVIAGTAWEVSAADYKKKAHKHHVTRHTRYAAPDHDYGQKYPDANGWYPRDSSKLAFGSAIWWEQMLREGRLNQGGGRN